MLLDDGFPDAAPPDTALPRLAQSGDRALLFAKGGVLQAKAYGNGIGRDIRLNFYAKVKTLVGAWVLRPDRWPQRRVGN